MLLSDCCWSQTSIVTASCRNIKDGAASVAVGAFRRVAAVAATLATAVRRTERRESGRFDDVMTSPIDVSLHCVAAMGRAFDGIGEESWLPSFHASGH